MQVLSGVAPGGNPARARRVRWQREGLEAPRAVVMIAWVPVKACRRDRVGCQPDWVDRGKRFNSRWECSRTEIGANRTNRQLGGFAWWRMSRRCGSRVEDQTLPVGKAAPLKQLQQGIARQQPVGLSTPGS